MRRYYYGLAIIFVLLAISISYTEAQAPLKMRLMTDTGDTITTNEPVIRSHYMSSDGTMTFVLENPLVFSSLDPPITLGAGINCTIPGDGTVRAQEEIPFSFDVSSSDPGATLSAPVRPFNASGFQAGFSNGVFQWTTGPGDTGAYWAIFQADNGPKFSQIHVMIKITPPEVVTSPTVGGPTTTWVSQSVNFTASGATSSLTHTLEYQFDWKGDGSVLSGWGAATQSHSWANPGSYGVRAKARCITHQVESPWSSPYSVNVSNTPPNYTVTVTVSPLGAGSVTLSPPGGSYPAGTLVTLTANAGLRYTFNNWSGGVSGTTRSVTITVNSNVTATANFRRSF
jgi:hypothetical protein